MNREELQSILNREGFYLSSYSLWGKDGDDTLCIRHLGWWRGWEIYYTERGRKSSRRRFRNEHDACVAFLDWIRNSPSLKKSW